MNVTQRRDRVYSHPVLRRYVMKKATLALVVLLLAALASTAAADVGNNPNHFELVMYCEGEPVFITVPGFTSNGAHVSDGRIAHARTHYIDFDEDGELEEGELVVTVGRGRGIQTTWCTWTWDDDPFLHGMDIQFSPAN
jgi:hypothetical protein